MPVEEEGVIARDGQRPPLGSGCLTRQTRKRAIPKKPYCLLFSISKPSREQFSTLINRSKRFRMHLIQLACQRIYSEKLQ